MDTSTHEFDGTEKCADESSPDRVLLLVTTAADAQVVDFEARQALTIGRGELSDVRLPDPSLSRLHARFRREGAHVRVTDLGSRNGTSVGGRRVAEAVLCSGEAAVLGGVTVTVLQPVRHVTPVELVRVPAPGQVIRRSPRMLELQRLVHRAAASPIPVLIIGETGTGKELVARELHEQGPRKRAPLKVVNCAAIPNSLLESILFGHCRGAFTGADRDRPGVFAQAHRGTLFLDEVAELSAAAQAALLRVLETKRICPVGGERETEVDVRVVAATHRDLSQMVRAERFRLDLYHRLNTLTLELPPLRERPEEIEPLTEHFLATCVAQAASPVRGFAADALAALREYGWPGNVRELRNVVERAVALAEGELIRVTDLPAHLQRGPSAAAAAQADDEAASAASDGTDLRASLRDQEATKILNALRSAQGSRREAARLLNLPLRTFERKLSRLRRTIGDGVGRGHVP